MKRIINAVTALCAVLFAATGCNDTVERTFYEGPEFVMFQDTLQENYVTKTGTIKVTVGATVKTNYDRTFGVEIVAKGSTAIEDYHFNLVSDNVTIKAGELATEVEVQPHYENFEPADSLGTTLRLVLPQQVSWNLHGQQTKVTFAKYCDFNSEWWMANEKRTSDSEKYNYANYLLYASFPYTSATGQFTKLLVKVEADPRDNHRLIIKNPFQEGRDLKLNLVEVKPGEDYVHILPQETFFSTDYGWITMTTNELYPSTFDSCKRYIEFQLESYKDSHASFGVYPYYMEWISERAAEEIHNNGF